MADEEIHEVQEVILIEPTKEVHPIHFMPNHGDPVAQAAERDFRPTTHVFRNEEDVVVDVPTEDGHGNMTRAGQKLVGNVTHPSQAKYGQKPLPLDEQPTLTEQEQEEQSEEPPSAPTPPSPPESPAAPAPEEPKSAPKAPGIAAPRQGQQANE